MTTPITHRLGCAWLITPATAAARAATATRTGADVVVVDLEDSVPEHAKDAARAAALHFLTNTASTPHQRPLLGVRINILSSRHGLKDLVALAEVDSRPAIVLVPKVESPRDLDLVADVLDANDRTAGVWALIETPRAIQRLPEILRAPAVGVVFGAADYAATAGCRRTRRALWYPRSALAAAAAAAGVPAIDSPFFDLNDPSGLRTEAEDARDLGFTGKGAVHPDQLAVITAAFTPTTQEIAAAAAVVAAADRAHGDITTVDGQMVGPPLIAAARAVTTRAAHIPAAEAHP